MSTIDSNCTAEDGQVRTLGGGQNAALDNTYKIVFREGKTGSSDCRSRLAERYFLQAAARELLPSDRVAQCNRHIIPEANHVSVKHLPGKQTAYYGNIMRCERVWHCPVCAARISEERRRELNLALSRSEQYYVVLATFTVGHHAGQRLAESLKLLQKGYHRFMSGRAIVALKDEHEIDGFCTALEVTHGDNGWHPHIHALVFLRWGGDLHWLDETDRVKYLDERIGKLHLDFWLRWKHIVASLGGEVSPAAFDVRATDEGVTDYVSKFGKLPTELRPAKKSMKWGPADELTKAVVKRGRAGGRTPFELLHDYAEGDAEAGKLFVEYAKAMKRKQQLRWSAGMREKLGLGEEKQLGELITEDDVKADVLAELDLPQWRVVLRNKARGRLLEVAVTGDVNAVYDLLDSLPGMEETSIHYIQSVRDRCLQRGISQTRDEKRGKTAPGASGRGAG